jgi:hypothetical protein
MVAQLDAVRAATEATAPAVRAALAAADLDPAEVTAAMAAAARPPGLMPEDLEDAAGRSLIWPPHPIQTLTCEPATGDDYARRTRAHPDVGRAWTMAGRLPGIAWNGLPTGTTAAIAVDEDAPAITLVVEWTGHKPDNPTPAQAEEFLRDVLRRAIGPEAGAPFPDWRADSDELEPRRTIADEVGASVLADASVLVQATLVTGPWVDRTAVVAGARARIGAFFAAGRPPAEPAALPAPLGDPSPADGLSPPEGLPPADGPWPPADQPPGGWIPGDPVRFTEVVSAIVADPDVWGVEGLAMKVDGAAGFVPQSAGALEIPAYAVPVLAGPDCLRVRFSLTAECGDA